jgi:2-iminobutanoate/2-iminopropanoate deaminase
VKSARGIAVVAALATAACNPIRERHAGESMSRNVVASDRAPKAIGPYSQGIEIDGWVYCSGQIALDPATGELIDGDVRAQTERALRNLEAVLRAAGCSTTDVVKTTVFLADLGDFAAMNEVYGRTFAAAPPARSTVQAAKLPRGGLVEIEAIARRPK